MDDRFLLKARQQAERAVADMPDTPLKLKAFEVILNLLLQVALERPLNSLGEPAAATKALSSPSTQGHIKPSEQELVAQKRPANHAETVAVLAFSLRESGIEQFTEEDIKKAYLRAILRPPKVISQAIRDAKNKFDYIELGKDRGYYRLTDHGDRTVRFDLPRHE